MDINEIIKFEVEEEILPPVNEFKRFIRVFFSRKIVIVGFVIVIFVIFCALFASIIAPYDPYKQDLFNVLSPPSTEHILGTDTLGRDLFSRLLFGARVALLVGLGTVLVSSTVGTVIGLTAGFIGGKVYSVIMRLTDALMSIPNLLSALIICAVLGTGERSVIISVSIAMLPGYIRLTCGQVLSLKENDYIRVELAMGATGARTMFLHLLPNCISPLIVQMTMMMGLSILTEASLSYLNIGIVPPTAAWGAMVFDGNKYLFTHPILSFAPGFAIMIMVFGFNMVGDGLRDALDPKLRGAL